MNATSEAGSLVVDLQIAVDDDQANLPLAEEFRAWAEAAFQSISNKAQTSAEVTIRVVSESEMVELNEAYRSKQGSTNVLSFPFESDLGLNMDMTMDMTVDLDESENESPELPILGDLVICHQVVSQEAAEQSKQLKQHYAHMVVHGVLHLCGYDHQLDEEAVKMEQLETQILALMEIPNPYS